MADKTISALTAAGTLDGADVLHIVDGDGNSRKMTLAALKTFVNTDPSIVPSSEPFRGALAYRTSTLSVATLTPTNITWQAELYDTDNIFSVGAPTRLTVPTGVTMVRLGGMLSWPSASYSTVSMSIIKNGDTSPTGFPGASGSRYGSGGSDFQRVQGATAVIPVTAGDYFELRATHSSSAARALDINSWFSMEVIEATP